TSGFSQPLSLGMGGASMGPTSRRSSYPQEGAGTPRGGIYCPRDAAVFRGHVVPAEGVEAMADETMRAVTFETTGGLDVLRLGEWPRPAPGPGQALVRVLACGVNRLDIYSRTGRTRVALPHISGSEAAGEVAAYGPGVAVEAVPVGSRVAIAPYLFCGVCEYCRAGDETICIRGDILGLVSQGAFAEYVVAPAPSLVPLPEGVDVVTAAAM